LAKLALGPIEENKEEIEQAQIIEEDPETRKGLNRRRSIVVQSRRDGKPADRAGRSTANDVARKHPLWYPGAKPEWFVPTHTDRHGKAWCLADAALVMQAGARGFMSRRKRRLGVEAAQRVFQTVYAIKIQRSWRIVKARKMRKTIINNMSENACIVVKRVARSMVARLLWAEEVNKMEAAARKIQKKFRSGRMKLITTRLLNKKLNAAVSFVQRGWREYKRWIVFNRREEDIVYAEAKKVKCDFMTAVNVNKAEKGAQTQAQKRIESLERFHQNTTVTGRRNVLQLLKKDKLGGDFFGTVTVPLKDAIRVTTEQVLQMHAPRKDPEHVELKLQECFYRKNTSIDLSTDAKREDQEHLKIFRWPYALQGDHGMLRLTQIVFSHNKLVGLPLDFYNLTNLTDVRVNDNKIKIISPEITQLQNLKLLWLHYNSITQLSQVGKLTKLEQLAIDNNRLISLPSTLGFLTQLHQLRLENNPFQDPPIEILRTIVKPPEDWNFSIVLNYLRHLNSAHSSNAEINGFGINNFPSVLEGMGHLRSLSLSGNRIQEIPRWLYSLTLLTSIHLDDNRIERISKLIWRMARLTDLSLCRNRIKQSGLPTENMLLLTNLKKLNLKFNLILSPPPEVLSQDAQTIFRFMKAMRAAEMGEEEVVLNNLLLKVFPEPNTYPTIRKLDLSGNLIREFPMHTLVIVKLSELNLSGNLIYFVPSEISKLAFLHKLYLNSNSLTDLPKEIGQLDDLIDLDLSNNQLSVLPVSLPSLRNLRRLRASRNRLKKLPKDMSTMGSLQQLYLDYNNLESLPDCFEGMTQLKLLFIDANNLRTLPQSISKCLQLEDFSATKNSFGGLLPAFCKLPNVSRFVLSDNCIRTLPSTLGSMVSLTRLELERNEMEKFKPLHLLKSVETLILKRNFIKVLPPEIEQIRSLKFLDISDNQLVAIAPEIRFCTNLSCLDLCNNQLLSLPPYPPQQGPVLGKLVSLEKLYLRKNHLCDLPLDFWEATSLQELHLQENPWTGNHKLKRIVSPHPDDAGGELIVKVIEGKDFAKMDGRRGSSDPYVKLKVQDTKYQTTVIAGSLNPKWNQSFVFQLDDNPFDDQLECEVFDWDAEGSDDVMGEFTVPFTRELLQQCHRSKAADDVPASQRERWVDLKGEDDLGRPAKGCVRLSFEFSPLDGSIPSIQHYIKRVATRGWLDMAEKTQAEQIAMNAVKVRTHNPLDSEWEHDEVRHRDEIRRADRSYFAPSFYLHRLLTKHTDMNTSVMRRLILCLVYCFHGVQI